MLPLTPPAGPSLDPDRVLALSYVPAARRDAIGALWRLDAALAAVVAGGREPMIARIKLAWWRDALERLDRAPAPAEPVLRALADHVLPGGVGGARLAGLEAGWVVLLEPGVLAAADLETYASARGGLRFDCSAQLLGGAGGEAVRRGGKAWALLDLARHSGDSSEIDRALALARAEASAAAWPANLRPLGMLAALARRDGRRGPPWEPPGAPARMLRMLRHRLTGR